jgi:hypothetical protein
LGESRIFRAPAGGAIWTPRSVYKGAEQMSALWLFLFGALALGGGFYVALEVMESDAPLGSTEIRAVIDEVKDAAGDVDDHISERFGGAADGLGDFIESFPGSLGLDSDQPDSDDPPEPGSTPSTTGDPPLPGEVPPSIPADPDPATQPSGEDPDEDRDRVEVCNLKSGDGTSIAVSGRGANSHLNQGNTLGVCEE